MFTPLINFLFFLTISTVISYLILLGKIHMQLLSSMM